jgi:plasmid stability protein
MTTQDVTLSLPALLYQKLKARAEQTQRSIEAEALDALVASVTVSDQLPSDLEASLAQLTYLNDAALWQAARSTMLPEQRERLEELHHKQQREGLSPQEQAENQKLLALYRETILVRAQAAVLLKQRGYDMSDPAVVVPLP